MRIGILTFFESDNYGTVLQAYALQNYLEKLGHKVHIINLKRNVNATFNKKNIAFNYSCKNQILYKLNNKLFLDNNKKKNFKAFRNNYLQITNLYENGKDFLKDINDYDLIVSGGDQIWNPYHKVFSLDYMCEFLPDNFKRISYGSSFGIENINDKNINDKIKNCLSKYNSINVRETSGVQILKNMGLNANSVVDPVFLDINLWHTFVKPNKKRPYAFIYALNEYEEKNDLQIINYAKKHELDIKIMPKNRRNCMNLYKKEFNLSPIEFINNIANSHIVFTNSFHGLAFSIIFRKKICLLDSISKEAKDKYIRLYNILDNFGIKNFDFNNINENTIYNEEKINKIIKESLYILNNALN